MPKIKDRIVELRRVPGGELLPNPKNWRVHPEEQQNALRGILAEVGIADAVLARETPDGLMLIDGHLRADVDPTIEWPVLVLDVNEDEADKLLLTHDPLAEMATTDSDQLKELLDQVQTQSTAVAEMIAELATPKYPTEVLSLSELKEHPRNYVTHPDEQLQHLAESIREHGVYQNVVIANDGTLLSGHGVVAAAKQMNLETIPVIRLALDPHEPRALKILAGDNEVGRMAAVDDRALTEMLKEIKTSDEAGLLGTGYDDQILANLAMVTRSAGELENFDAAAEWVGMPEFERPDKPLQMTMSFKNHDDRQAFVDKLKLRINKSSGDDRSWSAWWPPKDVTDLQSVRFKG